MRWLVLSCSALLLVAACGSNGAEKCMPSHFGVEICDGLDNDCNGTVDENAECPTGLTCQSGACTCLHATCGNPPACIDTSMDVANCGGCAHACKPGESCSDSRCKCLPPAAVVCGGRCLDLQSDPKNCGTCNHACTVAGSICMGGKCVCPTGMIQCGFTCVNPSIDRVNCGGCGLVCDVACSTGKCTGVAQIAAGGSHSCARLDTGEVRCWGEDDSFELGDGQQGDVAGPVITNVFASEIAAGGHHTCALAGGKISCWGSNVAGQIGDGTTKAASKVTSVMGIANAASISLGDAHSCARKADGTVACWGNNAFGELGDGTLADHHAPVAVANLSNVSAIAVGAHHSCALRNDARVLCWGSNQFGELGNGPMPNHSSTPSIVTGVTGVVALRAGGAHTCAITAQDMFCWGKNDDHEIASPDPVVATPQPYGSAVDDAALGSGHICVIDRSGAIFCKGNAIASGRPTNQGWNTIAAGDLHTCARTNDVRARVGCWGANTRGQCTGYQALAPPVVWVGF